MISTISGTTKNKNILDVHIKCSVMLCSVGNVTLQYGSICSGQKSVIQMSLLICENSKKKQDTTALTF